MMKDICTVQELEEMLSIDTVSAKELLDGTIEFELREIAAVASYKGVTIDSLLKGMLDHA